MSRFEKTNARLLSMPKDFRYAEAQMIMQYFGLSELKASGSARKFVDKSRGISIVLHEPHPSKILKRYAVKAIIEELQKHKLI